MGKIIIAIAILLVYCGLPKEAQLLILIANFFIPDPIPCIDEIIQIAMLLK